MAGKPLIIAHRGASAHAPENTVPAIARAVEMGAGAVELDVQAAADDVPVCVHDVRLERTTGDRRRVRKVASSELASLDAGAWFGAAFKGTPVPTLAQALEAAGKLTAILCVRELPKGSGLERELRALVEGRAARTVVAVPDSDAVARIAEWKGVGRAFLADDRMEGWLLLEKSEKLGAKVVRAYRERVDARMVGEAHARGMEVFVFYADEEPQMRELAALGVDGILTTRPDRLRDVLAEG